MRIFTILMHCLMHPWKMHRKGAPRQDVAQWGTQGGPMKRHPVGIALDYAFNRCKSYADCMFIARGASDKNISVDAMIQNVIF